MKRTGVLSERIAISAVAVHGRAELLSVEVLTQLADLKAMFAHDLRPRLAHGGIPGRGAEETQCLNHPIQVWLRVEKR